MFGKKTSILFFTVGLAFFGIKIGQAAVITYSMSGFISPLATGTDPWSLGGSKPYTLTFTLDQSTAVDVNTASIIGARFLSFSATLEIDGVSASSVSGTAVNFLDQTFDSIQFTASSVVFGAVSNEFGAAATLPGSTFTFTNLIESPPFFGTVNTAGGTGFTFLNYTASVSLGRPVQSSAAAVPEPASSLIWLLSGGGGSAIAFNKRRRVLRHATLLSMTVT